jgi:glucosamine--fructose-6-phosphate aminotransferase (isomerizing)
VRPDFSGVEGEYFRDILDQPRALRETVAGLDVSPALRRIVTRVRKREFRVLILTGMGSSFWGLIPLQLELIEQGYLAVAVETSELVHFQKKLLSADTLLVAVSQSGRSAEVIRLLDSNKGTSPLLAITNTPDSPLAERAEAKILTRAGEEHSVACKTYLATLAALRWLGDVMGECDLSRTRHELERAEPLLAEYLGRWKEHVGGFLELLGGVRHLFLLGRGESLAAAQSGALIIKESDHFHAEGMSSAAFRHGPFEMLSGEVLALIFAGGRGTRELNRGLLRDVRERGGRAEWIGEDAAFAPCALPPGPRSTAPILEILPIQMVTLALALLAGREPGRFNLAGKVTTKE